MTDAKEYGKALFLLAKECKTTEEVARDIGTALAAFAENPEYVKLLDTPALTKDERLALVDKSFATLDQHLQNLIKIMVQSHKAYLFRSAAEEYLSLYDEWRGIVRVEAISAVPITDKQSAAIAKKLSDMLGKTAVVKNTVDPSILGGMKLRYGAYQLDGSVKTRLDKFEKTLKSTVI